MKKFFVFMLLFIALISLTGCSSQNTQKDPNAPAWLKEITGEISMVELDDDGDILIEKSEVTEEVRYYDYEFEGVTIGLLAVRDSSGNVRVVINTCQSCGGSPYAYFVQVGNMIQCQNCGSIFEIDSLGELVEYGCNPIGIENMTDNGNTIKIIHAELEQYKDLFENWKGPSV